MNEPLGDRLLLLLVSSVLLPVYWWGFIASQRPTFADFGYGPQIVPSNPLLSFLLLLLDLGCLVGGVVVALGLKRAAAKCSALGCTEDGIRVIDRVPGTSFRKEVVFCSTHMEDGLTRAFGRRP